MKKYLWIFTFLSMQYAVSAQFEIGIQGGINLSKLDYSLFDESVSSLTTNYFLGLSPSLKFSGICVRGDINYSIKGGELDMSGIKTTYRYAYLELIPQVEFRILSIFGLSFGPSFSAKLDEQVKFNKKGWEDTKDSIKNSDLGAYFSGRIYIDRLYGMIAYNHGLKDIQDIIIMDKDNVFDEVSSKSRNFQVGVGLLF